MVSAAFYGWTEKLQELMGKVNVNTKLYVSLCMIQFKCMLLSNSK